MKPRLSIEEREKKEKERDGEVCESNKQKDKKSKTTKGKYRKSETLLVYRSFEVLMMKHLHRHGFLSRLV
jgi:hypothetical protein